MQKYNISTFVPWHLPSSYQLRYSLRIGIIFAEMVFIAHGTLSHLCNSYYMSYHLDACYCTDLRNFTPNLTVRNAFSSTIRLCILCVNKLSNVHLHVHLYVHQSIRTALKRDHAAAIKM